MTDLGQTLADRELTIRELLSEAFYMLGSQIGPFLLLTALVYLPANLVSEIAGSRIPEIVISKVDMADINQMTEVSAILMRRTLLQLMVQLYCMISTSAAAIMIKKRIDEERSPFGITFNEGIRAWLRFLLSAILLLGITFAATMAVVTISMMIPLLTVPAITVVIIGIVLVVTLMQGACVMTAIRRTSGMETLRQTVGVMKDHIGKTVGIVLLLSLVSTLVSLPLVNLATTMLMKVSAPAVSIAIASLIGTVLGIFDVFVAIGVSLRFINLDRMQRKE